MNNQEILRKIVNYIENVMKEKSLTSRDLADICVKKTGKMSPSTTCLKPLPLQLYPHC